MTTHLQDLLVVNLAIAAVVALSWGWARAVRGGRPLTPLMRGMLLYALLFALGMGYVMMFGSWFGWPQALWFALIGVWGVVLALISWWRHRRRTAGQQDPTAFKR